MCIRDSFREACIEGNCQQMECVIDDDCRFQDGNVCVNYECIGCREPADCGENACNGNACLCLENQCFECGENADCGEGNFCVNNSCAECLGDENCAEGVCVNGACAQCREDADCDEGQRCAQDTCFDFAGGDTCDDALPYEIGQIYVGNNSIYGNNEGSVCGSDAEAPEVIFNLQADRDGTVCVSIIDADYDTVLFARGGACENNQLLAEREGFAAQACEDDAECEDGVCANGFCAEALGLCNDDAFGFSGPFEDGPDNVLCAASGACRTRSALEFDVVNGESYFLFVDGFVGFFDEDGGVGTFVLSSNHGPCDIDAPPLRLSLIHI